MNSSRVKSEGLKHASGQIGMSEILILTNILTALLFFLSEVLSFSKCKSRGVFSFAVGNCLCRGCSWTFGSQSSNSSSSSSSSNS